MNTKKKTTVYFGKEVENAINLYNTLSSEEEKRRLYIRSIRTALRTLIEAVIHRYKYYHTELDFPSLVDDSEGFLIMQFPKVNTSKGKAFSYLTVILRNYLTALSKKNYKQEKLLSGIDDEWYVNENINHMVQLEQDNKLEKITETYDMELFIDELIIMLKTKIKIGYPPYTKKDIVIFNALILVFQNRGILEVLNRKYLLYLLRENTGYKTKAISTSIHKLEEDYNAIKSRYFEIDGDRQEATLGLFEFPGGED